MADFPSPIKKLKVHQGDFPAFVLPAENCDVYFSSLQAGSVIPPHQHDTDNHSVVFEGELILELGGQERRFSQGQWCFVPAYAEHSARTKVDTRLIEFWFSA